MTLVQFEPKSIKLGTTDIKKVYLGNIQVRPALPYLCFTANTANSTVTLNKTGTPTAVTLETSTDGTNWSTYTIGSTITLSNIGDKVYWRNTSETDTGFSTSGSDYYNFIFTGSVGASGDVTYLLNKRGTNTLSNWCFTQLFYDSSMFGCLTSIPKLQATTLAERCYQQIFRGCVNITSLPKLPATTLSIGCYYGMLQNCSKIKISETQTGEYQTEYRIPYSGTGIDATYSTNNIFYLTGGTFAPQGGTPINTTYYTSNTVV